MVQLVIFLVSVQMLFPGIAGMVSTESLEELFDNKKRDRATFIGPVVSNKAPVESIKVRAESIKIFRVDNNQIRVTSEVDEEFYGLYKGKKSGYLLLKRDGTGEYKYDIFGVAQEGCREGVITFEWGCPVDATNRTVRYRKPYGYSYPVILKCAGEICFQGCSKEYLLEFILDKNDGRLHVSSSDDWEKSK